MALADLIRGKSQSASVALATANPATAANEPREQRQALAGLATVAVAIRPERKNASRWRLHFAEADALEVTFAPVVDQTDALAHYPDAIAAESMPEETVTVPADALALFDACAKAGLYGDADRAALPAMFALDPEGTHRLIEDMHAEIRSCRRCRRFGRPGLSDGYCTGRDDLPSAYGFMRALPDDKGATCAAFDRAGRNSGRLALETGRAGDDC